MQLGSITAFVAGMVNVSSVIVFFAFTSNITGHVAILAEEIAKGHWYQVLVVFGWLSLFFVGGFISNYFVITFNSKNSYLAHAFPLFLEFLCLISVGIYGEYFYDESLQETEYLVALLLLAMGLQNGLTASISNSTVKTTHLTGLFTELSVTIAMFTKSKFRKSTDLLNKAKLLTTIFLSYLIGGIIAGLIFLEIGFKVFFAIGLVLVGVVLYDIYNLFLSKISRKRTIGAIWEDLNKGHKEL